LPLSTMMWLPAGASGLQSGYTTSCAQERNMRLNTARPGCQGTGDVAWGGATCSPSSATVLTEARFSLSVLPVHLPREGAHTTTPCPY
jgi:hypothetical protein